MDPHQHYLIEEIESVELQRRAVRWVKAARLQLWYDKELVLATMALNDMKQLQPKRHSHENRL